jgi:hypothetical protein
MIHLTSLQKHYLIEAGIIIGGIGIAVLLLTAYNAGWVA